MIFNPLVDLDDHEEEDAPDATSSTPLFVTSGRTSFSVFPPGPASVPECSCTPPCSSKFERAALLRMVGSLHRMSPVVEKRIYVQMCAFYCSALPRTYKDPKQLTLLGHHGVTAWKRRSKLPIVGAEDPVAVESESQRLRVSTIWTLMGRRICRDFFLGCVGISAGTASAVTRMFHQYPALAILPTENRARSFGSVREESLHVVAYILGYGEENGVECPTGRTNGNYRSHIKEIGEKLRAIGVNQEALERAENASHSSVIWLSRAQTKTLVYEEFVRVEGERLHRMALERLAKENEERSRKGLAPKPLRRRYRTIQGVGEGRERRIIDCSVTYEEFARLWKRYCPHIRMKKASTDVCDVCCDFMRNNQQMGILKQHLHQARALREVYRGKIHQSKEEFREVLTGYEGLILEEGRAPFPPQDAPMDQDVNLSWERDILQEEGGEEETEQDADLSWERDIQEEEEEEEEEEVISSSRYDLQWVARRAQHQNVALRMERIVLSPSHPLYFRKRFPSTIRRCSLDMGLHVTFDYAMNGTVPHEAHEPGRIYYMVPGKMTLFGVTVETVGTTVIYCVPEGSHPITTSAAQQREQEEAEERGGRTKERSASAKASVHVLAMLYHFIQHYSLGEKRLYLTCDNCTGENKNRYLLGFLHWLIHRGIYEEIHLDLMLPGHTRCDADRAFGVAKQHMRRKNTYTFDEYVRQMGSFSPSILTEEIGEEDWVDLTPLGGEYLCAVKGMKFVQHFEFHKDHVGQCFLSYDGDDEILKYDMTKGLRQGKSATPLEDRQERLKELMDAFEPKTMSIHPMQTEHALYLYQKVVRPFTPPTVVVHGEWRAYLRERLDDGEESVGRWDETIGVVQAALIDEEEEEGENITMEGEEVDNPSLTMERYGKRKRAREEGVEAMGRRSDMDGQKKARAEKEQRKQRSGEEGDSTRHTEGCKEKGETPDNDLYRYCECAGYGLIETIEAGGAVQLLQQGMVASGMCNSREDGTVPSVESLPPCRVEDDAHRM